jgi:hypothetical protein
VAKGYSVARQAKSLPLANLGGGPRFGGGRLVLPDSSCPACAAITSAFERKLLRGFMWDARTSGGYPTRRPKERPKSLPLQVECDGVVEQIELVPHAGSMHG